jgi:hypothetical protein
MRDATVDGPLMLLPNLALAFLAVATAYSAIAAFRQTEGVAPNWIFPTGARRPAQIIVGFLLLALLIALPFRLARDSRPVGVRSSRFLIPENYTGWVRIEFEVQGASPLPTEGDEYVITIPADGVLRTSSPEQYGWTHDHYYYYSGQTMRSLPDSGEGALIWGKLNGEASGKSGNRKYEEFFVGTAEQFKNQGTEKSSSPF